MINYESSEIPSKISTACCKSGFERYALIIFRSFSFNSSEDKRTSSNSLGEIFKALHISARISASGLLIPCSQFETLLLLIPNLSANCT